MKKTKEVSKLTGVSKRALQYYDDEGLLMVKRTHDNHRIYEKKDLERIWEILLYKEMNFKLKEIRQLLAMSENEKNFLLQNKISVINDQITDLKVLENFIALIKKNGIPSAPSDISIKSYSDIIKEMRTSIKLKITKGK